MLNFFFIFNNVADEKGLGLGSCIDYTSILIHLLTKRIKGVEIKKKECYGSRRYDQENHIQTDDQTGKTKQIIE